MTPPLTKPLIVHQIEDAQVQLHKGILEALRTFSSQTGLMVNSANWQVVAAIDLHGHTAAIDYHSVGTSLSTSIS